MVHHDFLVKTQTKQNMSIELRYHQYRQCMISSLENGPSWFPGENTNKTKHEYRTKISPISAMYDIVLREWSIMISWWKIYKKHEYRTKISPISECMILSLENGPSWFPGEKYTKKHDYRNHNITDISNVYRTKISPILAMYDIVLTEWYIMISWCKKTNKKTWV